MTGVVARQEHVYLRSRDDAFSRSAPSNEARCTHPPTRHADVVRLPSKVIAAKD
ncbi:hypothetical protein OG800_11080 [Streptomyces sp. NBC_00445]|uniref:hypothetical protein n=1 Tax=Streptomyces sp. NBC_00445 TaxID=2975745 RepID=UPI002E1BD896